MMNELQVKKSNIFQWVSSIRIPHRKNSPNHSMAMSHDYVPRIESIRKKIQSLISAINESKKKTNGGYLAVRIGTDVFKGDDILVELHSAIGVYNIRRSDANEIGHWTKLTTYLPNYYQVVGDEWLDYLGDQSIRKGGGHIVVMLSHAGVVHLNEIAHKLYPFVQSPSNYTTRLNGLDGSVFTYGTTK
jgi:hypothetical protein